MDVEYMKLAIEEAKKAEAIDEVPIGAVIVYQGKVIGRGHNQREKEQSTLAHAEILAIDQANNYMKSWRLEDATLYVTLEPCQMCAGALIQSRIKRVVYAASDYKAGCAGSIMNLLEENEFNHQVEVTRGILQEEASSMLTNFFKRLRKKKEV